MDDGTYHAKDLSKRFEMNIYWTAGDLHVDDDHVARIVNQINLVQPYNMLLQVEKYLMNDSSRHL